MTTKSIYDSTILVRLPKDIQEKFKVISKAQYKPTSQLVRELIIDYVRNNQTVLSVVQPQQPTNKSKPTTKPFYQYQTEKSYFPHLKDPNVEDLEDDWL